MKRAERRCKRLDYRHILCVLITLGFVACSAFVFPTAFGRLIEGFRDFGISVGVYFTRIIGMPNAVTPTVTELPKIPFFGLTDSTLPSIFLPETWEGFKVDFVAFWNVFADGGNFNGYLQVLGEAVKVLFVVVMFCLPFIVVMLVLFRSFLKKPNNDYDKDTLPLRAFKAAAKYTYHPVKTWLGDFIGFLREHKAYWIIWLVLWAYNFNLFAIVLEFFAYYLYFAVSFDVGNLYIQVYKLFIDLAAPFGFIPWWIWLIAFLLLADCFRKKIAYERLERFERRNRGFINERPIVYMVCGTMGKKKTTTITDMVLSQEVMFRDKAFEKILENDLKFPYFPWINLENELRRAMEYHKVYNLATVRLFVSKKAARWHKSPCRAKIFGYDYERYGLTYDDKLKTVDVWQVIETYAQLYFIYIVQSSLIISNYSIRTDAVIADTGNFPLWNADFFKRDSRLLDAYSRHAHILDFDSLRLGRRLVADSRTADSFEFGVVVITEIGKERGNSIENQGLKKTDETTNQKNDLFNSWLKMVRHSATVDNFPFVRVITDEQRPESWGADARDLCEIVHVRDSSETRLAMPFFAFGEMLYDWVFGRFVRLYYDYRFNRGDNTLTMYLLKTLTAKISKYYSGIYNRFGYSVLDVQTENGTQDGRLEDGKYYLMTKKIYSRRFATDCFSDFFTKKSLQSAVGIDDLQEYATEKASFDELNAQNSYFVGDLMKHMGGVATDAGEGSERLAEDDTTAQSRGKGKNPPGFSGRHSRP